MAGHPNLITFDGHSVYFFGLSQREASRLLDGISLLNGLTGWLAYMLQEIFYDDRAGEELYGEIFDNLSAGILNGPRGLSKEAIYHWVERAAPEVEKIKKKIMTGNVYE